MWLLRSSAARIALVALAACGAVLAPFWVPLVAMLILSLLFRSWEVPLIGLGMDFLWLPSVGFFHPAPLFTIGSIALVLLLEPLRREFLT